MDHEEIKRRITDAAPDLLFVSFGCPKQEKWIAMHYRSLGVPVAAGVGATIDFLAGQVKRAPAWMQRCGVEWIFRLAQEPRRLFGRYTRDLWVFGKSILAQWWQFRSRPSGNGALMPPLRSKASCCRREAGPTTQLVEVPERLDLLATQDGALDFDEILNDGDHCLLQMHQVKFIDSTGIGLLIRSQKQLRNARRQLVLVAPSDASQRALRLMRLEEFFATAADVPAAIKLIESRLEEISGAIISPGLAGARELKWQGEVTAANAEEVWYVTQAHLSAAAAAAQPEVIIDLSTVRFIDSSGLGVMVRAKKLAQRHGTRLVFTNLQPAARNVIQLARLEDFLLGGSLRGNPSFTSFSPAKGSGLRRATWVW